MNRLNKIVEIENSILSDKEKKYYIGIEQYKIGKGVIDNIYFKILFLVSLLSLCISIYNVDYTFKTDYYAIYVALRIFINPFGLFAFICLPAWIATYINYRVLKLKYGKEKIKPIKHIVDIEFDK